MALKENEDRMDIGHLTPMLHGSKSSKIFKAYNGYATPIVFVKWFLDSLDWCPANLMMGLAPYVIRWANYEDDAITPDLEAIWGVHVTRLVRAQLSAARATCYNKDFVTCEQAGIPDTNSPHDTAIHAIVDILVRRQAPWVETIGRHGVVMNLSEHGGVIRASDVIDRLEELRRLLLLGEPFTTEACTFHTVEDAVLMDMTKLACVTCLNKEKYKEAYVKPNCMEKLNTTQYEWLKNCVPAGMLEDWLKDERV